MSDADSDCGSDSDDGFYEECLAASRRLVARKAPATAPSPPAPPPPAPTPPPEPAGGKRKRDGLPMGIWKDRKRFKIRARRSHTQTYDA